MSFWIHHAMCYLNSHSSLEAFSCYPSDAWEAVHFRDSWPGTQMLWVRWYG